jgi:hypothetical protein
MSLAELIDLKGDSGFQFAIQDYALVGDAVHKYSRTDGEREQGRDHASLQHI